MEIKKRKGTDWIVHLWDEEDGDIPVTIFGVETEEEAIKEALYSFVRCNEQINVVRVEKIN